MNIFISSVRRGLEEERDALPGLIEALGHTPQRFEDWTALPVPPREACMRAVDGCDAYLLLLGEGYGEAMPDTSVAPTEEEFTAAVGERSGLRLGRSGELTIWLLLPRDNMGTVLDRRRLEEDLAGMLQLATEVNGGRAGEFALAAALDPLEMMVTEGDVSELGRRTRVSLPGMPVSTPVRVEAEDAVPARSIPYAARDLARELALRLLHAFRQR